MFSTTYTWKDTWGDGQCHILFYTWCINSFLAVEKQKHAFTQMQHLFGETLFSQMAVGVVFSLRGCFAGKHNKWYDGYDEAMKASTFDTVLWGQQ